jgi:hypothetical protein
MFVGLIAAALAVPSPAVGESATPAQARSSLPSSTVVDGITMGGRMVTTDDDVFISSGVGGSTIAVMNHDGTLADTLTGIPGPTGLDASATKLFVAASGDSSIWVYSLTTSPPSKLTTLSTLPLQAPSSLARASGRLWFTGLDDSTPGIESTLGSMDIDGSDVQVHDQPDTAYWQLTEGCGDLDHSTYAPTRLFVHSVGCLSTDVLYEYGTGSIPPTRLAEYGTEGYVYGASSVAVTPDGSGVLVNHIDGPRTLDIDDLSPTPEAYDVPEGQSIGPVAATGGGGGWVATPVEFANWDAVQIWRLGEPEPTNLLAVPPQEGSVLRHGLAFGPSGDSLFVMTRYGSENRVYFHVVDPSLLGSSVTMSMSRDTVVFGEKVILTGALQGPPAGSTVSFTRHGVVFDSCSTSGEGSCSVPFTPRAGTEVAATYPGDQTYAPALSDPEWVSVHVAITGEMRGYSGKQGRFRLYGPRERVIYVVRVRPPHPQRRVDIRLQYNLGSGWHNGGHDEFRQDEDGYVAVAFAGGSLPPAKFRLRSTQAGDADHLGGRSRWTYFRVTGASRVVALPGRQAKPQLPPISTWSD